MAPREVYGCTQLWKRAEAEVKNFGVWPLGLQPAERGVSGHNKGVACGARETVTNPAQPHGPRGSQGPLGILFSHSRRWFRFGTFLAGYLRLKLTD